MTHLYVMQRSDAPQFVKVGRSDDPVKRGETLQSGHCFFLRVLAIFSDLGHHERWVHEQLEEFRVRTGKGQEWFQTDVSTVHAVIGHIGPIEPRRMLTDLGKNASDYVSMIASVNDASTAADIRNAIANASTLSKKDVNNSLQMDGFSEVTACWYSASRKRKRTSKRVYRKEEEYATLPNHQNK